MLRSVIANKTCTSNLDNRCDNVNGDEKPEDKAQAESFDERRRLNVILLQSFQKLCKADIHHCGYQDRRCSDKEVLNDEECRSIGINFR